MQLNRKLIKRANGQPVVLPLIATIGIMTWRGFVWLSVVTLGALVALFAVIFSVVLQPFRGNL